MTPERAFQNAWGEPEALAPLGDGHINDSFLVRSAGRRLVLQRVSQAVFLDPKRVMGNIARVLELPRAGLVLPDLVPTHDGQPFLQLEGEFWRVWRFLPGRTLNRLDHPQQATAIGRAYGRFQRMLRALPAPPLADPIEGFGRLDFFLDRYDALGTPAPAWASRIDALRDLALRFAVRDRHVHGDCKVNNVLFDGANDVCAVLDLDTVMWGHWAWDWGDLARSACARADVFELDFFNALLEGFVPWVAESEVDALVSAPCYVAGMLGLRFLTDHLQGDVYFKVVRHGDNERRAAEQFAVLADMEVKQAAMSTMASKVLRDAAVRGGSDTRGENAE